MTADIALTDRKEQYLVLVVEDDAALGELISMNLGEIGIESHHETSGAGALSWLSLCTPNLMLLDHSLSDMTAPELISAASALDSIPPFLVMTGQEDVRLAVSLMKLGARDYMVKDMNFLETLPAVVSRILNQVDMERRLKEAERLLKESEEKYRILVEMARDAIIMYTSEGQILDCNGATNLLFATDRGRISSANIRELFCATPGLSLDDLLFSYQPEDIDVNCLRADGSVFPGAVHTTAFPLGGEVQFIIYIRDNTVQKNHEAELMYMGTHDPLTSLYNRAFFDAEMKRLEQGRTFPFSIIIADLDGLKIVNDSQGHAAGDCLIKAAAESISALFRSDDIVARIGGDEFAVILPGTDENTVSEILDRARNIESACDFCGTSMPVCISFGSATAYQGMSVESVVKLADDRMYLEKNRKRTR